MGGFVGGFGWFWVVLGGFGWFWVVPCFSNYWIETRFKSRFGFIVDKGFAKIINRHLHLVLINIIFIVNIVNPVFTLVAHKQLSLLIPKHICNNGRKSC